MESIHRGEILFGDNLTKEYKNRKRELITESIKKGMAIPNGYSIKKELKTRIVVQKEKDIGEFLEDKVWCLLYESGMKGLSTKDFTLILKSREPKDKTKQIDVLAVDNDIAFVVECKTVQVNTRKSLKKDLAEFFQNMHDIREAVKQLVGNKNLQVKYIFATENIIWDQNDLEDAKEHKVVVWDEYNIEALREMAKIAGEGAKYQLYGRMFYGSKVSNCAVNVPALKGKMGGKSFYTFLISPEQLLKIAYVHHRQAGGDFLELADSYQRMINASRVDDIREYINIGGFFPGSVIVNFNKNFSNEEPLCNKERMEEMTKAGNVKPVSITLPPYYGCAWIIDGQHRLFGYADTNKKYSELLPVVAFVNENISTQTKIFVDINEKQKSLDSNILWDLYEDLYVDSIDDKEKNLYLISKIVKELNGNKKSPFYKSIDIPKEKNEGNINMRMFCLSIKEQRLVFPSKDSYLYKESLEETISYASQRIAAFFDVIKTEMPDEWEQGDKHYVRTNAAIVVFMGIYRDVLENLVMDKVNLDKIESFKAGCSRYLDPIILYLMNADKKEIDRLRGAGGAGQPSRENRAMLTELVVNEHKGNFKSHFLAEFKKSKDEKEHHKSMKVIDFLKKKESSTFELKGSLEMNIDRYLFEAGEASLLPDDKVRESVLKTIVGFLNAKGGDLLLGVLERERYKNNEELIVERLGDFSEFEDKLLIGFDIGYKNSDWDSFERKILDLIDSRIGDEVRIGKLVELRRLEYLGKTLCLVSVTSAETKKFLDGKRFFARDHCETKEYFGPDIDSYWKKR